MDGWEWMDGLDSTSSVDEILGIYEWKRTWPLMDVTRTWAREQKGYVHNCMHVIVTWDDH
ncbi:hypothetical protein PRIPAC_96536 [Pristionchus pacificus]|uniref:Uncharacterized protein n=1 Tax=Pristionchus pacificus TaxID=54126 RepID=A0A2A6BK64_PRIPA|nr:hypothetical protein PRIPAC_96536 [Pristionchus pacificus]|eukprot:PDM66181.1 hypothetical protein PRIPAC_45406 [Pristionchus pacificus]